MWFIKLLSSAHKAAGKRCTHLLHPPPLPGSMLSKLRWLIVASCLQSSVAAPVSEVVLHSYFKTCCYYLFICGVASCGMLFVLVGLAWLTSHLIAVIRGVVWVLSPLISKNVEGLVEAGGLYCYVGLMSSALELPRPSIALILSSLLSRLTSGSAI
jgi:hypothetical protein